jgi:hypothetical protein
VDGVSVNGLKNTQNGQNALSIRIRRVQELLPCSKAASSIDGMACSDLAGSRDAPVMACIPAQRRKRKSSFVLSSSFL